MAAPFFISLLPTYCAQPGLNDVSTLATAARSQL